MSQHLLFIPVEGPIELMHSDSESIVVVQNILVGRGTGPFVSLNIEVDNEPGGKVSFLANSDPLAEENVRAQDALVFLTGGVHMRLIGNVIFTGLAPEMVDAVVRGDYGPFSD